MSSSSGFRLGIYVFKDAEIVDFAAAAYEVYRDDRLDVRAPGGLAR